MWAGDTGAFIKAKLLLQRTYAVVMVLSACVTGRRSKSGILCRQSSPNGPRALLALTAVMSQLRIPWHRPAPVLYSCVLAASDGQPVGKQQNLTCLPKP